MLLLNSGFFLQVNGSPAQQWIVNRIDPPLPQKQLAGPWSGVQAALGHMVLEPDLGSGHWEGGIGFQTKQTEHDPFTAYSEDSSNSARTGDSASFASFTEMKETFGLGR